MSAGLASPAGAQDPAELREQREEARRRQAALAGDLDVVTASQAELDAAAAALAVQLRAQRAEVQASREAVAAATAAAAQAQDAVVAAREHLAEVRSQLVDRAVQTFISPERATLYDVAVAANFSEAARKQAFIHHVVAEESALVDRLDAARVRLEREEQAAEEAEAQAAARRAETEAQLAALEATAAEQARVEAALEQRRAGVVAEIDALAQHEAQLSALIEQREREERERREREERERREREERERQEREERQRREAEQREREAQERRAQQEAARREREASARAAEARAGREAVARDQAAEARSAPAPAPQVTSRSGGGACIWPTRGWVTSEFGHRWGRLHAGIDIATPVGTPIVAVRAGTVLVAGDQGGYGTTVVVGHGDMTTLYAHQSRVAVSVGESVSQGEVIGYTGNTGHSTGPHLHFETRFDGVPRNPRGCLG